MQPMFHTYGGHPVHCAAAEEVLRIMDEESLVERVGELAPVLEGKMRSLESLDHVAQVRGRGFLWSVEIVRDAGSLECFDVEDNVTFGVMAATAKRGVFTYFGGTGEVRDVINIAPHFIIGEAEMDRIVTALAEGIEEVCAAATTH
jgi:adenosylmethionine-8-amino-7-oxononanoate aminotransferase